MDLGLFILKMCITWNWSCSMDLHEFNLNKPWFPKRITWTLKNLSSLHPSKIHQPNTTTDHPRPLLASRRSRGKALSTAFSKAGSPLLGDSLVLRMVSLEVFQVDFTGITQITGIEAGFQCCLEVSIFHWIEMHWKIWKCARKPSIFQRKCRASASSTPWSNST